MRAMSVRSNAVAVTVAVTLGSPVPALAEGSTINAADTAWMISATGLVLMMSIPGLALFYCGMVRKKNVLATMAVGWDRGADRASNDADVSSIPPIIPYGGFSPVRLEGWPVRRDLPSSSFSLSLLPAYAD